MFWHSSISVVDAVKHHHGGSTAPRCSPVLPYFPAPALLSLLLLLGATAHRAEAQAPAGTIGVGGIAGSPSGLAVKYYRHPGLSADLIAAFGRHGRLYAGGHLFAERSIPDSPLRFFTGPGVFLKRREDAAHRRFAAGVGAGIGVDLYIEQFEIFLQVSPRLQVIGDLETELGGGIGLRYFFR